MPAYTWKIQLTKHYSDEFLQKGSTDKEKAVEEFQLFPWDKELDDFKRSADIPTIPKIIFSADDQRQLVIEAININGFNIRYSNFLSGKFSDFYVSNDFEKNNFSTEEIIGLFFDSTLESYLKLEDIETTPTQIAEEKTEQSTEFVEFNFKPNHWHFISPRSFLWLVLGLLYLRLSYVNENKLPMIGNVVFIFVFLAPTLIHLTYLLKNYSAKVKIDRIHNELTYTKGSTQIKFNRDDIFRCQVTTGKHSLYSTVHNYSYAWFILNNGTHVTVTCFVADPFELVRALKCKYEEKVRTFTFLPI
ncbi:hypothetical protein CNR22_14740 [Sphingobacteriaceae bacterium]|nr:hypothetical protein CNR22_14740 [Sphingobacteriaceae bacterium]